MRNYSLKMWKQLHQNCLYYLHSLREIKKEKGRRKKRKCNKRGVKAQFNIEVYMLTRKKNRAIISDKPTGINTYSSRNEFS